jgi:hypothetical protein
MVLHAEDPTFGGVARIRRQWPELHGVKVNLEAARRIAADELGADYLTPPSTLRQLLGWTAPEFYPHATAGAAR